MLKMKTVKEHLDEIQQLITILDKEELQLCNGHFKKAVSVIELNFSPEEYPSKRMNTLRDTIRVFDRGIRLKNRSDTRYYQKLVATAILNLMGIHQALVKKYSTPEK